MVNLDWFWQYWNSIFQYGFEFEHPERLWYFVPMFLIFLFFLRKQFVFLQESSRYRDDNVRRRIRIYRILMFFSRGIIFLFLVIALAGPIVSIKEKIYGERSVTIILDRSDSMGAYDTSFVPTLQAELEKQIPVKLATIGSSTRSNIGDGILGNLGRNRNLLLISDGNANAGSNLGDAALFASELNASISMIEIAPNADDYSVTIDGPSKVLSYSDAEFQVIVRSLKGFGKSSQNFEVRVLVDGKPVSAKEDTDANEKILTFKQQFDDGQHKIEAFIRTDDFYEQNNHYFKTVKSVPKPKILFLSKKSSPLEQIFVKLYDMDKRQAVPDKLENYYAIIINDMPADSFSVGELDRINDFVSDGNGLIVFGGDKSFEYGKYRGSKLASMLPVTIGVGEKQPRPDLNAVVVIDISEGREGFATLDLAKAHSLELIPQFRYNDNVGVIAFSEQFYTISGINMMTPDHVADIKDKIHRLKFIPATTCSNVRACSNVYAGITGAMKLLEGVSGRKWIFLYSDGIYYDYSYAVDPSYINTLVSDLNKQNIVLYTTMTTKTKLGDITFNFEGAELNLRKLAEGADGIYFPPSDSEKMRLLFGNTLSDKMSKEGDLRSITVLNRYHFITQDLEPSAKITGYNQIVPKASGRLLMTTSLGDPLLVIWHYALGRVAVLGTDDGTAWAPEILNRDNSKLISRIVNWGIGDPERKLDFYSQVGDGIVNETIEMIVKSSKYPKSEDLSFYKIDDDLYSATFRPSELGFGEISKSIYAANYKAEYESISPNNDLPDIIESTHGKIFKPTETNEIIDFVSKRSERVDIQKKKVSWPFVIVALAVFLIEVIFRKIGEQSRKAD